MSKDTEFGEAIQRCRRCKYHEVADILEYYGQHDTNRFGPVYHPLDAPTDDSGLAYRLLWAFRAGRAFEYGRGGDDDG